MRRSRWSVLVLVAIAALLLAGRALAGVYADYRWYAALDATAVWDRKTVLSLVLRLSTGTIAAAFVFANLYAVRHSVVSLVLPRRVANLEIGEEVPGRYLVGAALVLSVIFGALLALGGGSWTSLALARGGVSFGEADPYFESDLGFFVYWLPLENTLYVWTLIVVLLATALVVFLYALTPSLRWERGTLYVSHYVRRHLVVLGCLMLLVLAWSYRLDAYKVMLNGSGDHGAFTFTDHRAMIPVNLWLSILTGAAAFVVLFFGWTGQIRVAFAGVSAVLILALGLRQVAPAVARHLAGESSPEARERPYRQVRSDYTRRAYALDRVGAGDSLAFRDPGDAIDAISVWDPAALERALLRLRWIDGVPRGVAWDSSAAGITAFLLDGPGETGDPEARAPAPWHVTRVRAAAADGSGEPVVEGPRAGDRDAATLPRVLVYDAPASYVLVPDSTGAVAAPDLVDGLSRLAFAWSRQNVHLLSSEVARAHLRIVTRRGVRERVRALAPFFVQGTTVLPVLGADSLFWVVDLYSASDYYPLSEHAPLGDHEYSYVHHAGSAVVNAHTGRVSFVMDPAPDPIAQSWIRAFPALLGATPALPSAVLAALPPAVDATRLQALELSRYGMRGTTPPMGHLPWNSGADSVLRADAPALSLLPRHHLGWTQAVLDSTDRVAGLVVGLGGRARGTYWLPLARTSARWNTLLDELHRAADSAESIPRDARLVRGEARAIAVGDTLALVQPAYAWRPDAPPVLASVGMVRDTLVTAGRTLPEALGVLAHPLADTTLNAPRDFRAAVGRLYDAMRAALQRGDWAAFGRAYDALGALVGRRRP